MVRSWYSNTWCLPYIAINATYHIWERLYRQVIVYDHYNDVIMSVMASQITSVSIVYSSVCSGENQNKRQRSASLAFVRGIHRWPINSPHKAKGQQHGICSHLMTSSCGTNDSIRVRHVSSTPRAVSLITTEKESLLYAYQWFYTFPLICQCSRCTTYFLVLFIFLFLEKHGAKYLNL